MASDCPPMPWVGFVGTGGNTAGGHNTYSFFDLSLVCLQLALQLLHQLLHALVGLVVLLCLKDQLFQAPLVLLQDFHRLHVALLLRVQVCLQLLNLKKRKLEVQTLKVQDAHVV